MGSFRSVRCFATGTPTSKEERRALRLQKQESRAALVGRIVEKAKTRTFEVVGIVGAVMIVSVGGLLMMKAFSDSSEYRIYDKAIKMIENDDEFRDLFGFNLRFHGERDSQRGHHQGLRHERYQDPRDGSHHVKVWFHVKALDSGKKGQCYAEVIQNKGLLLNSWDFVDVSVTIKSPSKYRRAQRVQIYPKKEKEEKD